MSRWAVVALWVLGWWLTCSVLTRIWKDEPPMDGELALGLLIMWPFVVVLGGLGLVLQRLWRIVQSTLPQSPE